VTIYIKLLFAIAFSSLSPLSYAESAKTEAEWVVVLDDPRPARLRGWQRNNYSVSGDYRNALELKRTGQRIAKKHDLLVSAEWFIETLGVYCLIVTINEDQKTTLDQLRKDKKVKSVQRSNSFELLQTKSQQKSPSLGMDPSLLDPPELALSKSITGDGVVVAIVDSAVDQTHPDIVQHIIENLGFVDDSNMDLSGEPHGTAVAGVIVADHVSEVGVTGVASGAKIKAYRGCWENADNSGGPNCNTLTLARALDAVATKGKADILNLSLSGPKDELLDQLILQILSQGTTVVVAFDPNRTADDRFPSNLPGIVTVRANFMDQDHTLIFSAPGKKVVATPQQRANFMQGHSIATAYTSGVLAMCAQIERELKKEICTPSLFKRFEKDNSNNLRQLISEMERELESAQLYK
jgi:subtilisin family serine protease